jgi:hypothetical protein
LKSTFNFPEDESMSYRIACALAAAALSASACADDSDPGIDMPDANPACPEPNSALTSPWQYVDAVSEGVVSADGALTLIDATAGGGANAADNPYLYLAFTGDAVEKVDVTDLDSYGDPRWDLALKRFVLRVNGGDSGPGGVEVAAVEAEAFADVTAVPAGAVFTTDDWVTDDCQLNAGMTGEPLTAMGDWYDYDVATNRLAPRSLVYVLRRPDGSAIKLSIASFYHDDISGFYEIEWASL